MPKQLFKVDDFSGGTNGYADPQNILDNELAQCSGFKAEPGEVLVIGDMKAAYTPSAAGETIGIEPGYGLFTFSHDYDKDGDLAATNYYVMQNEHELNIYDDTDDAWVNDLVDLGTGTASTGYGSFKPCFFFVDGTLRVSPGNFAKHDTGADMTATEGDTGTMTKIGRTTVLRYGVTSATPRADVGDILEIDGIDYMVTSQVYNTGGNDHHVAMRNITGFQTAALAQNSSSIYVKPDPKWRGIVQRRAFSGLTTIGTFTEWFTCPMAPRPWYVIPTYHDDVSLVDFPFILTAVVGDLASADGYNSGEMIVGYYASTASDDGVWDTTINLYVTALYDDVMQESVPIKVASSISVASGKEFAVAVNVQYSHDGTNYRLNKRVVGARLYYEDSVNELGTLYQLLEINFEKGCKKAEAEGYTEWEERTANKEAICPATESATATARTGAYAFVWDVPPKSFTYEINTGYPADTSIYTLFKTAVVANRRTYAGNLYYGGKAHGDRMIK